MARYDVIIRGAHPAPVIGIAEGVFVALESDDARRVSAREEIDATGLLVMPGVVDAHVHFNEPGRTDWEGWATGTRAAVAGGTTTVCDMPLNSTPPVVTVEAFEAKRAAAEAQALCDFALWGGLVPGFVDRLDALAGCGVIGFKAFMANSGIDDFPKVDLATLKAGMQRAAALRLPVAVHAEFDRHAPMEPTVAAFLASRPIESECEAIRAALDLAGETGCALHVVHVSSARGLSLIVEARARGVDVTAETCPHYLVFTDEDLARLGAVAKCAPPLRPRAERDALVARVRAGDVDTLGSDHSPSPWTMKAHDDFSKVWGGIAGVQHLLPLALDTLDDGSRDKGSFDTGSLVEGGLVGAGPQIDASPQVDARSRSELVARLTADHPARRFGLASKGRLAPGFDADLTLVEIVDAAAAASGSGYDITTESLLYRHRISPYVGRRLRARVRRTLVRGRTVFHDGRVTADRGGRLLTPMKTAR